LTNYEDKNEESASKDANYERAARREQFLAELVHEFTNMVTAVIGYSDLAIHAI
jgi:signal transduction histidine kinase